VSNTPAVQRLGSAVLLQGPAVADAAYLVAVGVRTLARRDGVAIARWLTLQRALQQVAAADHGHADVLGVVDEEALLAEELVSTKEAAHMLRLTERQVRRIAACLGGRHAGRALVFDRSAVQAEAARRRAADEETS